MVVPPYTYTCSRGPQQMRKKLTLTVDEALIPRAKSYAYANGKSLSSLVEEFLRDTVAAEAPTVAERWRGKFRPAERDGPRYEALARKYL